MKLHQPSYSTLFIFPIFAYEPNRNYTSYFSKLFLRYIKDPVSEKIETFQYITEDPCSRTYKWYEHSLRIKPEGRGHCLIFPYQHEFQKIDSQRRIRSPNYTFIYLYMSSQKHVSIFYKKVLFQYRLLCLVGASQSLQS